MAAAVSIGRSVERDVDDVAINDLDRPANGYGVTLVLGGHIVEGTVRLEVGHLQAGVGGHRLQGADLIGDHVLKVAGVHLDAPPTETPKVIEAGMHADADALLLGQHAQPMHGVGIAGMKAAGDAGGLDDLHQVGIVADIVGPPAFGDIGIEIDHARHAAPRLPWKMALAADRRMVLFMGKPYNVNEPESRAGLPH